MLRVTVDTNIDISALQFGGMQPRLLRMAAEGIQLVTTDEIMDEVSRVLRRPKFAWSEQEVDIAIERLSRFTERVHPTQRLDVITIDRSDNRILECADAGKADYIVSGDDRHLRLKQHGNAPIVKVAAFLKLLQPSGSSETGIFQKTPSNKQRRKRSKVQLPLEF